MRWRCRTLRMWPGPWISWQIISVMALRSGYWVLGEYSINFVHQINRGLIEAYWRVVGRGPADLEQFALARQAQIGVFFTDHLRGVHDGLIASALVTKNHFPPPTGRSWREALWSRRPCSQPFLTLSEKTRSPCLRICLPFPRAHCVEWSWRLAADLLNRLVTAQRLKRNSSLKLVWKVPSSLSFSYPFVRVGYILARCPILPDHFKYIWL